MLDNILLQAPAYLLVFVRCFALLMVLPMFSMRATPRVAKIALAGYMAFFIFGTVDFSIYAPYITEDGTFSLLYILILIGEALIGIIIGFYITIIFAAFSAAGQFLAFQMGLSAASSYDSLSQVENPLMGQFLIWWPCLFLCRHNGFRDYFLKGW